MSLLDKFQWFSGSHGGADYFTDKLTRIYSLLVFVILAIILSLELHRPDAIECWTPAYYTDSHTSYTNNECKFHDYSHIMKEDDWLPKQDHNIGQRQKKYTLHNKIKYLPAVLIGQALLFVLPGLLWRLVSDSLCGLYGLVRDSTKVATTYKRGAGLLITSHITKLSKMFGGFGLSMLYLVAKFMYFITCIIQLWIMYDFLGFNFMSYFNHKNNGLNYTGFTMPDENGTSILVSEPFPRHILCDFKVRQMGNIHFHQVLCRYQIIEEVEVIVYMAWVWVVMLIVVNAVSGMYNLLMLIVNSIGLTWKLTINAYLSNYDSYENAPMGTLDKFISACVKPDVAFVLNMIGQNGSMYAVHWAVRDMWDEFMRNGKIHAQHDMENTTQQFSQQPIESYEQIPLETLLIEEK